MTDNINNYYEIIVGGSCNRSVIFVIVSYLSVHPFIHPSINPFVHIYTSIHTSTLLLIHINYILYIARALMFELGRHACFYIPRKCRGVLFICCFLTIGIILISILHVSAALLGVASHESQLTEKQIKATIPKQHNHQKINNKLRGLGHQWERNITNNIQALLSRSKFVNLTERFKQNSDNIRKRLSQAQLKLKDGISKYQNKSLLRQTREIVCQPITPKTVFFIRIPK